jgi:membrane glycosyltransferase
VVGVVSFSALAFLAPGTLWWLAPIWGPLMLAIPLSFVVSSRRVGRWFARCGLLQVPSERDPDELVLRAHDFQRVTHTDDATRFRDLVLDPLLVAAQLSQLSAGSGSSTEGPRHPLCERALRVGPAGLTLQERQTLATDPASLRWLHRHAWQRWPVESWQMGRHRPQLPTS